MFENNKCFYFLGLEIQMESGNFWNRVVLCFAVFTNIEIKTPVQDTKNIF